MTATEGETTMATANEMMNAHFQATIDAYRSFLRCEGLSLCVATQGDGSVVIEPDDSDRTFTFTVGNRCVLVSITNGDAKATQQYNMHGVTQPTLHHIREHLNQMSECEDHIAARVNELALKMKEAGPVALGMGAVTAAMAKATAEWDPPPGAARAVADYSTDLPMSDIGQRKPARKIKAYDGTFEYVIHERCIDGLTGKEIEWTPDGDRDLEWYAQQPMSRAALAEVLMYVESDLPHLVVDLREDRSAMVSETTLASMYAQGRDERESRQTWIARKTAELEARFSATIRQTLREWPTHHGLPMVIHTHVDQGVFVLTLKAAP